MSWLFEKYVRHSEKNGRIVALRRFGIWSVFVERCEQTGPSLHRVWKDAYKKSAALLTQPPKNILLLGLGAGGEIEMVRKHFPGAHITVVEHDHEMIRLAEELKLYHPSPSLTVTEGDAKEVVALTQERFDIIAVDIFRGPKPSPLIKDPGFLELLHRRLQKRGLLLVNAYRNSEYLQGVKETFIKLLIWKSGFNTVGIFRRADDDIVRKLPEGYIDHLNWPEFDVAATIPRFLLPREIPGEPHGTRWQLWPFSFEQYVGDTEPVIALHPHKEPPFRVIMWRRLVRDDIPPGWHSFTHVPYRTIGFSSVSPGEKYFEAWSHIARSDRRHWLTRSAEIHYRIRTLSPEEFLVSYRTGTVEASVRDIMADVVIKSRLKRNKNSLVFWGVERITDGVIVAGMTVVNSPSCHGSCYVVGFHTKDAGRYPMTGLIDHWFNESQKHGLRFLHYENFWQPGNPESWKGFSAFKAKFGPHYIVQPPVLYKFRFSLPHFGKKS